MRLTEQAVSLSLIHRRAVCLEEMTCATEEEMIFLSPCEILPGTNTTVISFFFFFPPCSTPSHTPARTHAPSLYSPLTFIFSALHPSLVCHGGSAANPSQVGAGRTVGARACAFLSAPVCLYSSIYAQGNSLFSHLFPFDTVACGTQRISAVNTSLSVLY